MKRALGGAAALSLAPLRGLGATTAHDPGEILADLEALDLGDWAAVRQLFPLSTGRTYLNTGGLGPPSKPVLEAMRLQAWEQAVAGEAFRSRFEEVRTRAAAFLGADPDETAFTRNATESNSLIAAGLRLEAGDEVIIESHAHPGGSFPWLVQQKEKGVRLRIFEPDPRSPEGNMRRIFDQVTPRTRVIQVSHLTAPTGLLFDVPAIAREARRQGIWFHVDGAQSAGMIPVDFHALGCDSYATSGHKWLNGPQESGLLIIAAHRIDDVACSHAGAYSDGGYDLPDTFQYGPTARRHEYGTRDAATLAGLEAAFILQERIGRERIARHGKALADECRRLLSPITGLEVLTPEDPAMHGSMLTFRLKGRSGKDLAQQLSGEHHLRCREVSERGLNAVRLSWHLTNSEADVEQVAVAVRALARA